MNPVKLIAVQLVSSPIIEDNLTAIEQQLIEIIAQQYDISRIDVSFILQAIDEAYG